MRITQKLLFGNFLRDINRNRGEMAEIQSQLSSGKRVRFPSQEPIAFQRGRVIDDNLRQESQFQQNIDSGLRQSRLAQESLDSVIDRLIEVKGIAVQGASDSFGENNRENMADQVRGIRDIIVGTLNQSYGDRYLFAGTNSAQEPFEIDAGTGVVNNNSNNNPPLTKAGEGVDIEISITGQDLANTPAGDLFAVLDSVEQALRDNDAGALNALLPDADDVIEHVTDKASALGNNINRMEFLNEQYETSEITQKSNKSALIDTDYAQAASDMQRKQIAFEAAMAVQSNMFRNTLLDYL